MTSRLRDRHRYAIDDAYIVVTFRNDETSVRHRPRLGTDVGHLRTFNGRAGTTSQPHPRHDDYRPLWCARRATSDG